MLALAPEELSPQFLLERLDGTGQRRLRDIAFLGRPGEVQRVGQGQEIAEPAASPWNFAASAKMVHQRPRMLAG